MREITLTDKTKFKRMLTIKDDNHGIMAVTENILGNPVAFTYANSINECRLTGGLYGPKVWIERTAFSITEKEAEKILEEFPEIRDQRKNDDEKRQPIQIADPRAKALRTWLNKNHSHYIKNPITDAQLVAWLIEAEDSPDNLVEIPARKSVNGQPKTHIV